MNEEYIKVKDLSDELGLTISNLNIQIARGHAGEVEKAGGGETGDYLLTLDNVLELLNWLRKYGRGNKRKLLNTREKYEALKEEKE